jgi:hypothetical protein
LEANSSARNIIDKAYEAKSSARNITDRLFRSKLLSKKQNRQGV